MLPCVIVSNRKAALSQSPSNGGHLTKKSKSNPRETWSRVLSGCKAHQSPRLTGELCFSHMSHVCVNTWGRHMAWSVHLRHKRLLQQNYWSTATSRLKRSQLRVKSRGIMRSPLKCRARRGAQRTALELHAGGIVCFCLLALSICFPVAVNCLKKKGGGGGWAGVEEGREHNKKWTNNIIACVFSSSDTYWGRCNLLVGSLSCFFIAALNPEAICTAPPKLHVHCLKRGGFFITLT